MKEHTDSSIEACGCQSGPTGVSLLPAMPFSDSPGTCCGTQVGVGSPLRDFEKPGYQLLPFVDGFLATKAGEVPRLQTRLSYRDIFSSVLVRLNIRRDHYKIAPGLYAIGDPDENAPVVVTANYKLSVDHVRRALDGRNAFLLILDTFGVNVWCAAGKGSFSTDELARRITSNHVGAVVAHRKLILPQLGATGVSATKVKKQTGFEVVWGPIRAHDLGRFLDNGMQADKEMRQVTFSVKERAILIPVEMSLTLKPAAMLLLLLLVLSSIGSHGISLESVMDRWPVSAMAIFFGIVSGAVLTPALLPYIHGVSFAVKGVIAGLFAGVPILAFYGGGQGLLNLLALSLMMVALSSYLAMNFTGATPFTSPSGVEKEMRLAIPLQAAVFMGGLVLWIIAGVYL